MSAPNPSILFLQALQESLVSKTFQKLTLGKYRGDDEGLEKIKISTVLIKGAPHLSFVYRYRTRDVVKNFSYEEARPVIAERLGNEFLSAHLFISGKEYALEYSKKKVPQLRIHEIKTPLGNSPIKPQNREKQYIVPPTAPFLLPLGVANERGEVRGERYDKFKQINKFVEIFDSLLSDGGLYERDHIRVVDFGSGKNYLTFALYYLLSTVKGISTEVIGVEQRRGLVEHGSTIAHSLAYGGLSFVEGTINTYSCPEADVVVALHACDTATDDALAQALRANATVIAVAPCCQKYVRSRLKVPEIIQPIFKHGILVERLAESLTDGLRALVLESKNYRSKVFEFISPGHTPKNVMITGVKNHKKSDGSKQREEIEKLKEEYGLPDFYLDTVL